MIITNKETFEI